MSHYKYEYSHIIHGFSIWYKKTVIPKKKVLLHGTLKIVYQVYHSKPERKKRKSKFFIATLL